MNTAIGPMNAKMNMQKEINEPDASAFSNMNENTQRNGGIENGANMIKSQAYGKFMSKMAIKMMTQRPRMRPNMTSFTQWPNQYDDNFTPETII